MTGLTIWVWPLKNAPSGTSSWRLIPEHARSKAPAIARHKVGGGRFSRVRLTTSRTWGSIGNSNMCLACDSRLQFASGGRSPGVWPKISRLRAIPWIQRCPRLAASASRAAGRPIARRRPPRLVWKLATSFSQPSPATPNWCGIGGSSAGIRPTFPGCTCRPVHSRSSMGRKKWQDSFLNLLRRPTDSARAHPVCVAPAWSTVSCFRDVSYGCAAAVPAAAKPGADKGWPRSRNAHCRPGAGLWWVIIGHHRFHQSRVHAPLSGCTGRCGAGHRGCRFALPRPFPTVTQVLLAGRCFVAEGLGARRGRTSSTAHSAVFPCGGRPGGVVTPDSRTGQRCLGVLSNRVGRGLTCQTSARGTSPPAS
jgi:hypothetical protein